MKDANFVEFPFADYLLVFISIIVGYVVTEFFNGWGTLIRHRHHVKIYWLHIAWTINFFTQLMVNWWWLWGNRVKLTEHIIYFFYTLISPLMFYFISVYLFPRLADKGMLDFKQYYYKNTRPFFGLFVLLMATYCINNLWLRGQSLLSFDNIYCYTGIVFGMGFMFIKEAWFHKVGFVMGSVVFITYAWYFSG